MPSSNTRSLSLVCLSFLVLSACGKKTTNEADEAYYIADSAVGSLNGALNDSEQANTYARTNSGFELIPSAYAASCGLSRFSPSVGANCNSTTGGKTVIANFAGCTAGRSDEFAFNGQVTLTFDANSTCNTWLAGTSLPTSGSVVRSTTNFTRSNPNGSVVASNGSVTTTFGAGTRTVSISNLHRTRTSAAGRAVYDHTVTTTAPIVASGTRLTGNRVVSSGTIRVDHNLANYSSTATLAGLSWNASCCHPTGGSITFALSGNESGSILVDYATGSCGEARISKNGSVLGTVDLPSCE